MEVVLFHSKDMLEEAQQEVELNRHVLRFKAITTSNMNSTTWIGDKEAQAEGEPSDLYS